ncbi:LuxR C-terminal-related transcriptional regulator [Streptomyces sp. NPDC006638]|uniref:LuxR C-terminal-related transcriptional regulator n=1 Tax=Streptomyces sp. NPDC006638 TaxID=3157183 RepID=UPI0033BFA21A
MNSSTTVRSSRPLYGRSGELAILGTLLDRLKAGHGGTLVLTAPPGLGRTALLDHTAAARADGTVLRAEAASAERLLPYSGLHALLCSAPPAPLRPPVPLPLPLGAGVRAGPAGTALLGRLTDLGAREPLLVLVDDAHAWDPASRAALAFAARRLPARGRVAVLLTVADHGPGADTFAGLPALRLGPLDDDAATALLDQLTGRQLDPAVREELRREGAGNPRLLTALAGHLTAAQLSGQQPLPRPLPGGEDLLDAYAASLDTLPADTRALLLFAAAAAEHEPDGAGADAVLLLRAGRSAGIRAGGLAPAEHAGVVRSAGGRVRFTHPLLRTAVLRTAPPARRRAVHRTLAGVLDDPHQALPRLVQAACAAAGPDAALAHALTRAAAPPRPYADRAAALVRAAGLTADEVLRGARLAAAAEQAWLAGRPGEARLLLARVRTVPPPGRAHYVRGLLALHDGPAADARETLLTAADLLPAHDADRAVSALLGAAEAAWAMGDAPACREALDRIRPEPADPVLESYRTGMSAVLAGRTGEGHALLRRYVDALGDRRPHETTGPDGVPGPAPHRGGAVRSAGGVRGADTAPEGARVGWGLRAQKRPSGPDAARGPGQGSSGERGSSTGLGPWQDGADDASTDAVESWTGAAPPAEGARPRRIDAPIVPRIGEGIGSALLTGLGEGAGTRARTGSRTRARRDETIGAESGGTATDAEQGESLNARIRPGTRQDVRPGEPVEPGNSQDPADLGEPAGPGEPSDPAALLRAGVAALVLGEVDTACRVGARALALVRARGADALLPQALEHLAYGELRAGRHARARAHAREGLAVAGRLGQRNAVAHLHAVLALAASVEGDAGLCATHARAALAGAGPHGLTQAATLAGWAVARAELAEGRCAEAAARLAPLVGQGPRGGHFAARMPAVPCYIEALVLAGQGDEPHARTAVEEFTVWAAHTADPQAPAQLARCQALLAPAGQAARWYEEALRRHEHAPGDFERARTQLLHGHWLRRRRRTREARGPLRDALIAFERCGADLWSGRVRGELRAAGETVPDPHGERPRGAAPLRTLTPQQQRIARCVAEGATNREVALRLSLSPRTVDHHLRNVFATLGIRSRTELVRWLDRT